jgi:predicted metal-dependent peptidase
MATNRAMLKEAIADAKAVKETAIANAKAALEEAFAPQVREMLSLKLQEMDEEENKKLGFGDFDTKENTGFNKGMNSKALDETDDKDADDTNEVDLEELLAELEGLEEDVENESLYEAEEGEEGDEEGEPIDPDMTDEELKDINDSIDRALREGGMLAGRMGAKLPRSITDLLEPKVRWDEALREFVSSSVKGKDEFTWRRMNKRHMANDIYLPSVDNETLGEVVVAIDTSGSIGSKELTEFASELASICEVAQPEKVRVLWWDTEVHGEQVFEDNFGNIGALLKPLGGGGTHVSSVSEYINKEKITADCVIVFTDGYVESDVVWNITSPTLWMITQAKHFEPPSGKKVIFNNDD